jgi:hypothetical protein
MVNRLVEQAGLFDGEWAVQNQASPQRGRKRRAETTVYRQNATFRRILSDPERMLTLVLRELGWNSITKLFQAKSKTLGALALLL